MDRCSFIKDDGKRCLNKPSTREEARRDLCWHHQKSQPIERKVEAKVETKYMDEIKLDPSRKINVISGPSSFYYYPNVIGKKILLLGETHDIKNVCKDNYCAGKTSTCNSFEVHDWIYQLALHAPQCLDIFVEEAYYDVQSGGNKLNTYAAPLLAVRDKFKHIKPKYAKEGDVPLSSVRYHNMDIRNFLGVSSPFVEMAHTKGGALKYAMGRVPSEYKSKDSMKTIITCLMGCNRNMVAQKMFYGFVMNLSISIENYKIGKGVADPIYDMEEWSYDKLSEINNYIRQYDIQIQKEMKKVLPYISLEKFCQTLSLVYMNYIGDDWNKFIHILIMLPMDMYVLLRLFIKYVPTKLDRGPINCQSKTYEENKNVIIYAGALHIEIYKDFILKYFVIAPTIGHNKTPEQCIELENPFDFFG